MENKYYTPQIEEFHVGFEYEMKERFLDGTVKNQIDFDNAKWKSCICDSGVIYIERALEGKNAKNSHCGIRVKYLDKQDIEEVLKVKQLKGDEIELNFQIPISNSDDSYEIDYETDTLKMTVELFKETDKNKYSCYTLFSGKIKNKTEFKKLLSQLEIS